VAVPVTLRATRQATPRPKPTRTHHTPQAAARSAPTSLAGAGIRHLSRATGTGCCRSADGAAEHANPTCCPSRALRRLGPTTVSRAWRRLPVAYGHAAYRSRCDTLLGCALGLRRRGMTRLLASGSPVLRRTPSRCRSPLAARPRTGSPLPRLLSHAPTSTTSATRWTSEPQPVSLRPAQDANPAFAGCLPPPERGTSQPLIRL
jgi:hypothetical protein